MVDSSGSIEKAGEGNWNLVLTFITDVVGALDIGPSRVRVGMVLFGNNGRTEFYLTDYQTESQLIARVLQTDYLDQRTNIADGIELMRDDVFEEDKGDRPDVQNIGIVISDGKANERENDTLPEANQAKAEDIVIISVGVTNEIDEAEMIGIANSADHFIFVEDFAALSESLDVLVGTASQSVDTTVSRSSENTCTNTCTIILSKLVIVHGLCP